MALRVLISLTSGNVSAEDWAAAAREEPRSKAKPSACRQCPLRIGGELEEGLKAALKDAKPRQRASLKRWGCHAGPRPCAGMRRLLVEKSA